MNDNPEGVDTGEKQSVKKQEARARREQERIDEDLRSVLSTYQGRSFIWELLTRAGIYRTTFSDNAAISAFNEGIRQSGLHLIARIDGVDQNAYAKLRREAVRREEDK
jgi:hypothetical protein